MFLCVSRYLYLIGINIIFLYLFLEKKCVNKYSFEYIFLFIIFFLNKIFLRKVIFVEKVFNGLLKEGII